MKRDGSSEQDPPSYPVPFPRTIPLKNAVTPGSLQAVIFDMDGVLIDSEPLHERAQRIVFAANGIAVPDSVFSDFKGQTEEDVFNFVVRTYGGNTHDTAELVDQKHLAFRQLMAEVQPIEGAVRFVHNLRDEGFLLGLTTSAIRRDQKFAIDLLELEAFFAVIVTADDVTRPKPHPEPYLITVDRLQAIPASCLVIEDSLNGVRSAAAAGCRVAGITTSFAKDALMGAGADVAVDSFDELREYIG